MKNEKVILLICILFSISILTPFLAERYTENISNFFSMQKESGGILYSHNDFTWAIKYVSKYISIYLGIVSQLLLVYFLYTKIER